jgi:drug/metabolite transporter superfamily protein YnfA
MLEDTRARQDLHRRLAGLGGAVADGYRPDRFDIIGALICLVGVGFIMYAPRH